MVSVTFGSRYALKRYVFVISGSDDRSNITHVMVSMTFGDRYAPKRYVYTVFGDLGGPLTVQTLHT